MPTNLDRVQCLLQPEPHADLATLAKLNRRSKSAMAAELVEVALKLPKYQKQLKEAAETVGSVPAKPDPRLARRQAALTKQEMANAIGEKEAARADELGIGNLSADRIREFAQLLGMLEVVAEAKEAKTSKG